MTYRPINMEVYEKTKDFVIVALELLMQKGKQIPCVTISKHKIKQEEPILTIDTTQELQPCFDLFILRQGKIIQNLPEYKACIQAMHSDPTITKHISGFNFINHAGDDRPCLEGLCRDGQALIRDCQGFRCEVPVGERPDDQSYGRSAGFVEYLLDLVG